MYIAKVYKLSDLVVCDLLWINHPFTTNGIIAKGYRPVHLLPVDSLAVA